jgi:hypothetical protein
VRARSLPLGLALGCYLLMLIQRPGWAITDTKIDLSVDPWRFLGQVSESWTPTGSLGHIWGSQYVGYLFPMGPFFALGDLLGLAPWLVERLWMGTVLALGAWGVVRLLDAMLSPERGVAQLVAGVLFVLNPYVIVVGHWRSVQLLAYAALPWLLLAVQRGLREPRRWWWPAAFALLVTTTGAGVNAALTGFVLLGPGLLLVYEPFVRHVDWRAAWAFAWRAGLLTVVTSLWWIAPVLVQVRYGHDFQQFTEGPGTIWGTTSVTEVLRLMGFWVSYVSANGSAASPPYLSDMPALLFDAPVVAASLIVPALVLGGYAWTRRWAYGPFFLALVLLAVLVLFAGFPQGTAFRDGLTFVHNHVASTRVLRTTYKVAPLAALGLACLGGLAAALAWARLRAWRPRLAPIAAVACATLVAVAAWPLSSGRSTEDLFVWKQIPPAWRAAAHDLDRDLPANTRAIVLPGQLFGFYRWGGTFDPILPSLAERPVAGRFLIPWADLHATDMLWTTDGLIQERRVRPGQVRPLLDLMGAGDVVTGTDDDRSLSGVLPASAAASELRRAGLGQPLAEYGERRWFSPAAGTLGPAERLPEVRRYGLLPRAALPDERADSDAGTPPQQPGSAVRLRRDQPGVEDETPGPSPSGAVRSGAPLEGLVRVRPRSPLTVVDGSAEALAGLAAFGELPDGPPLAYAGDRSAAQLRADARAGAAFVISDSNRRRAIASARLRGNQGWTLPASESFSEDAAVLDPFDRGPDAQTVAVFGGGARRISSLFSPQVTQFPERRPFAAFDGDPDTVWLADRNLAQRQHWIEVEFERPRDVDHVDLLPYGDSRGRPLELGVAGRHYRIRPGWNRLPLRLHAVRSLRIEIVRAHIPARQRRSGAPGGFREIHVPGLHATEALRTPVLAERALAGTDLRRNELSYLFERTSATDPFRPRTRVGALQYSRLADSRDAESGLERLIDSPAARRFEASALVSANPAAADDALDRLAGYRGSDRFRSSSRFEGRPSWRASRAFDGNPRTSWIGEWVDGGPAWLEWQTPTPERIARLQLTAPRERVRRPTRVRLVADGRTTPALDVTPGGLVELPRPLRARRFRLELLTAELPPGAARAVRAIGIGELRAAGISRATVPRSGPLRGGCEQLRVRVAASVAGSTLGLRPVGTVQDLDAGRPLGARGCGSLALRRGSMRLSAPAGTLRVDLLRLRSAAPAPVARPALASGRVLDPGTEGNGRRSGARIAVAAPSWLILAESYDRGWRATCDGRSLGTPVPLDGFANGWPVDTSCRTLDFAFAPGQPARWIGLGSGLACLFLLVFLLLRPPAAPAPAAAPVPADRAPLRWPLARAAVLGVAAAAVLGFLFAWRAGVVLGPVVALVLWRGSGARTLALAAGGLLAIVVPAIYVLFPPADLGGHNSAYATELLGAHWVGVAAIVLLGLALWRSLAAIRADSI